MGDDGETPTYLGQASFNAASHGIIEAFMVNVRGETGARAPEDWQS